MHHAVTILVRMDPQESDYYPDIILTLDTNKAEFYNEMIAGFIKKKII